MTIPSFLRSRFFITACIFIAVGVTAVTWAMKLMDSTYAYRSPLRSQPPTAQEPLGHAVSQRMIIILVDGLTEATSQDAELMPYLQTLRDKGAWATMHSRPPSYSQPGYSTLLVGAWPDLNDGPALNLDYEKIPYFTQDNLFTAVHRAGGRTAIAAHHAFEKLIPLPDVSESFYTEDCNRAGDEQIFPKAMDWVKTGGQSLVLVHFCQVDEAGDILDGTNSPEWGEAATRVDGMIKQLAAKMDFTKDTLMILSDHGHLDSFGHGGPEAANLVEPFILVGAGVWPGYFGNMQMVDVAPTAAVMLGVSIPASAQGRVLTWMLTLPYEVLTALPDSTEAQQAALYNRYAIMIGTSATLNEEETDPVLKYQAGIERARENRLGGEIMGRAFLLLIPAAVAVYFVWKYRGRNLLDRILLFVLYGAVFTAVYMLLFHQTFSLSHVPSVSGLIVAVFASSAAGFLAAWLANAYWKRFFSEGIEAIADNTLALAGVFMAILSLFVAAHFVVNGTVVRWTLPEMNTAFFGLLSMLLILSLAVLGGLLAGGAALINLAAVRRSEGESGRSITAAPAKKSPVQRAAQRRKRTGRGGRK
ncbi:MAG: alkaline phosphatase family protein [Anaerolineales bacterium]|nr:alkaline phosphatase family protein [Anaerolineales bacterium]